MKDIKQLVIEQFRARLTKEKIDEVYVQTEWIPTALAAGYLLSPLVKKAAGKFDSWFDNHIKRTAEKRVAEK